MWKLAQKSGNQAFIKDIALLRVAELHQQGLATLNTRPPCLGRMPIMQMGYSAKGKDMAFNSHICCLIYACRRIILVCINIF